MVIVIMMIIVPLMGLDYSRYCVKCFISVVSVNSSILLQCGFFHFFLIFMDNKTKTQVN